MIEPCETADLPPIISRPSKQLRHQLKEEERRWAAVRDRRVDLTRFCYVWRYPRHGSKKKKQNKSIHFDHLPNGPTTQNRLTGIKIKCFSRTSASTLPLRQFFRVTGLPQPPDNFEKVQENAPAYAYILIACAVGQETD